MEENDMQLTAMVINDLLEAIAQLIESKTSDKEAAEIVRSFKLGQ